MAMAGYWGGAPFGALPGLGKHQHSLEYLLLHCFSFLSTFVEGNGGCTAVCNGTRQKAHCLACHPGRICFYVFSFIISFVKLVCKRKWGSYCGLQCAAWYTCWGRLIELCLLTLYELLFLAGICVDLVAMEQWHDTKKGRLKPSDVQNRGKFNVFLQVVSPQPMAICQGRRNA